MGQAPKFKSYWRGPFRVLQKYSEVNYLVNCGRRGRAQVVHVDRMRLCKDQLLRGEDAQDEQKFDRTGASENIESDFPKVQIILTH